MMLKKLSLKRILMFLAAATAGLLLSFCKALSAPAPFAAILPAVLTSPLGAASLAGTIVGGLFTNPIGILSTAAASAAALMARLRFGGLSRTRSSLTVAAFSSGTYLMASAAMCAFTGGGLWELARAALLAATLLLSEYVLLRASSALGSARGLFPAHALFILAATVCAACSFEVMALSPGGILAAYAVMFAAVRHGPYAAASAAAVCAVGAGICSPGLFGTFALLAIPAFACSLPTLCSPLKSAAAFTAALIPSALIFGDISSAVPLILDGAVASALFVPTYGKAAKLANRYSASTPAPSRSYRAEMLRSSVEDISERLLGICERPSSEPGTVSDAVYSKVCMSCQKNALCFENGSQALNGLDTVSPDDLGEFCRALPECSRISDVRRVSFESARRRDYILSKTAERGGDVRLCAQLLEALGSVITDAERAALKTASADPHATSALKYALRRAGVKYTNCLVYPGGEAEVTFPASARINGLKAAAAASAVTGNTYREPQRCEFGESVMLRFCPEPEFSVGTGECQLAAREEACGDYAGSFDIGRHAYFLLSDGMGVGRPARAVSETLAELIKELLSSGFSPDAAIRLAGAVLTSSSPEESFATLDLLRVDRMTGAAELYKAGAYLSVAVTDGESGVLREGGYPIGILNICDIKVRRFFVKDSATVAMLSDGAGGLDLKEAARMLREGENLSPTDLATAIMGSLTNVNGPVRDDTTVAVVRIKRKGL